ncbi:hypothetical protein H261_02636 [Paramagnetospirillum caucaseum]|uniref:Lipoprotein n=1 Tax=Paramagnetospirillum caucaseum TaxID=1244869 RepID=M2ZVU8_9PROT|nr:hypothetical protein [Paramagnetospirillum caucaseum]EME71522.1 hypothetical protein H261_02636 [Paramagnetospirillum caucaseum]
MNTLRIARLLFLVLAAPLVLSGCDAMSRIKGKTAPPCPPVYIMSDAAKITKYRSGAGRDLTDVEMEGEIVAFKGDCVYDDKGGEVSLQLAFELRRGPAAQGRTLDVTYFVAVPKFYPAAEAKGVFTFPVTFPDTADRLRATDDEVVMRLPVKTKELIDNYEIFIGFQLTPEEMEMNRRNKR